VQFNTMGTLTVETNQLIARLAADCVTVKRLHAPWQRTGLWLMFVLPCVAAVLAVHLTGHDVGESFDIRMVVEQAAILLTGSLRRSPPFQRRCRGAIGGSPCYH
jgi:hypothetical protein